MKLSDVILRDTLANRPAAGTAGRLFYDTTNNILYRDNGSSWDSVEAADGAWASYTPTWSTTGTAPAVGNGGLAGAYKQFGKLVVCRIALTMGSTTTFGSGNWRFALPVTQVTEQGGAGTVLAWDSSAGFGYVGIGWAGNVSGKLTMFSQGAGEFTSTVPFTWAVNDRFQTVITYEAA